MPPLPTDNSIVAAAAAVGCCRKDYGVESSIDVKSAVNAISLSPDRTKAIVAGRDGECLRNPVCAHYV